MNRKSVCLLAALAVVSGSLSSTAQAADEETQLWLNGTVVAALADNVTGTFELSRRIREDDDQILLRGNADLALSGAASAGIGAAYVNSIDGLLETGDDRELRVHQQVTLNLAALSFRTRLEERFFQDANQMQLRIRQRVQVRTTVAKQLHATLSGEMFYIARSEVEGEEGQISQWRFNASLAHKVSPTIEATAGYLVMYTPHTGAPDQIAHVAQLTLTYRP